MKWLALFAFIALWAALIVWSLRTFWRTSDDPRQARIYAFTKCYCIIVTAAAALLFPLALPVPDASYWGKAVYWGFFAFPATLPAGHWSWRVFLAIFDPLQKR
jgi:hypothetical protein